ncbi:MAG: relaxase domain-containing protein [Acidimicrobiia bacterium]|nr:relaxase domain-containing protein [Acidimicrobiia bacterium]
MLSLGKLAPGQHQYYVDTVARGAEEYYTGAKEAPGNWTGNASGRLGLDGEVDGEDLTRVLAHTDPSGVYRLTGARSVPTVAGFDVTFCAPKSVSLLFALGAPGAGQAASCQRPVTRAPSLAIRPSRRLVAASPGSSKGILMACSPPNSI